MSNKTVRVLLPICLLLLFLLIMTSDWLLKRPFGESDDVLFSIASVREDLMRGDWVTATADAQRLRLAWSIVAGRVQFSAERGEMEGLSFSVARLQGAIQAKDLGGALMELAEAEEHWRDLGR